MPEQQHSERIVSGPIIRTVFALALPVTLGMLMQVALSLTDFYWVGKLGAAAQDAITSSMVIIWTVFAAISIISTGVTALVARNVGAGDHDTARFYIQQSAWFTIGLGVLVCAAGYFLTELHGYRPGHSRNGGPVPPCLFWGDALLDAP
jgi:Na+-driven multidrug efflux pump